jgi:hypothetical protein
MKNLIYFLVVLFLFSCQKVIDVTVDDADENIVIDAFYDANASYVNVKITRSRALFSGEDFEVIGGAEIDITTSNGDVYELTEIETGTYVLTNLSPDFNSTYVMKVLVDGQTFEAAAFLPSPIPLDSLTQEFQPASLFGEAGYIIYMNLTDPGGENFFRAIRTVNDTLLMDVGDQFLFDNGFTSGNAITVPFFGSRYQPGDVIQVDLRSYSKEAAQYYSDLFALAGDGGQSAAPANPRSNWSNDALGLFNAYGYDSQTITIEEEE